MTRRGPSYESAGWLGKREAVWPSGPMPNKRRSKPPEGTSSRNLCSYSEAAFSGFSGEVMETMFSGGMEI
jgi:hypothetical protein